MHTETSVKEISILKRVWRRGISYIHVRAWGEACIAEGAGQELWGYIETMRTCIHTVTGLQAWFEQEVGNHMLNRDHFLQSDIMVLSCDCNILAITGHGCLQIFCAAPILCCTHTVIKILMTFTHFSSLWQQQHDWQRWKTSRGTILCNFIKLASQVSV